MDVKKAAAETKDYIVSIRREFHRHPELSLQEFRTAQRIEEELDKFGIPHTRVGETGVLGTLKGAKDNGKVLVLRADIDALPIEKTHEKVQSRLSQPVCWMVPSACSVCTPRMIWRQAR